MLYSLFKLPAKLAFYIYCRNIKINNREILKSEGPLLIAANHPNSFFDAVILATIFKQPIISLARGDVYKNNFIRKLLTSLNMLPVYRISEGAENLNENYSTFDRCKDIFRKNGIVLIFSEGRCENEWHLRPLKKGTARLALSSWEEGIPLRILPAGINFQSFKIFGKNLILNFGNIISKEMIDDSQGFGKSLSNFNAVLQNELKDLVYEIPIHDLPKRKKIFEVKAGPVKKTLLFIPSFIGMIIHAPVYIPVKSYVEKKFYNSGHFDSIMAASLFTLYPLYLVGIAIFASYYTSWWAAVFILLPFTAWAHVQLKRQF